MRSGNRDQRIELLEPVESLDADRSVVKGYTHFCYAWAKRVTIKGEEKILAQQNLGTQIVSWEIPFVRGFNKKYQIIDDEGQKFDIFDLAPIGRNVGWLMVCVSINEN